MSVVSNSVAQHKAPFIFRLHEKKMDKHMHAYLKHDTLIETSGASIHAYYANSPNKPYLLLLHGMGVDAKTNWYRQIKALSKEYNLIVPDLIYFGTSTSKKEDYSVEFQATQIHEMLVALNIKETVHVMGFSYGGLTAAIYNQLFPSKGSKLILIDAPVKYYSSVMADSMANLVGVPSITNLIAPQSLQDFSALKQAVISSNFLISKNMKRKIMEYYFTPTLEIRKAQIHYLKEKESLYQNYSYNFNCTQTLLIWGAKDGIVPLSVGKSIAEAYPETCKLIVFPKAKHDVHFRYPKKLNKLVLEFLKN